MRKMPSTKAFAIARSMAHRHLAPWQLVQQFDVPLRSAREISDAAASMYGPGGRGETAYARMIDRHLRKTHVRRSR